MSNTSNPISSSGSSNPNNGASFTNVFGLSREQFVNVALRGAAPVAGVFAILWVAIELFARGRLSDLGISTTSIAAGLSLLGLGARITLSGATDVGIADASAAIAISGILLTFPVLVYVGAWFGLRRYVGTLPKKGIAIASAVGAGIVTFGLTYLVSTTKSAEINDFNLSGTISISVFRAILVASASAALATIRFADFPLLQRAEASIVILKSVGIWLVNTAIVVWIIGAMYVSLQEGSGPSDISVIGWLKVSILVALAVVLGILVSPHLVSLAVLMAVGANILIQGAYSAEISFFASSSNSDMSNYVLDFPLLLMIPIVLLMIIAAARVSITENSKLWYESATVFGLLGAIIALATRISFSGSGDFEFANGSGSISTGIDLLPAALRMATLGALLGSFQHPRFLPFVVKATSKSEQIFSLLKNIASARTKKFTKVFTTPFNSLISKNNFIAGSKFSQRIIALMLTSAIAVLFAAGSGKAIATVGERFISNPQEVADSIADAFRAGNSATIEKYLGSDTKIIRSAGAKVEVVKDEGSTDFYRSFSVVLSNGKQVATIRAYKSDSSSDTHFFGLVPGWNVSVSIDLPYVSYSYSGASGFTIKLNDLAVSSSSSYVMPGKLKVDLISPSPSLFEGSSQTLEVLESTEISLQPTLTAIGSETAMQAVKDSLNRCVGVKECLPSWMGTSKSVLTVPTIFTARLDGTGNVLVSSEDVGTYEDIVCYFVCSPQNGEYQVSATVGFKGGQAEVIEWSSP